MPLMLKEWTVITEELRFLSGFLRSTREHIECIMLKQERTYGAADIIKRDNVHRIILSKKNSNIFLSFKIYIFLYESLFL